MTRIFVSLQIHSPILKAIPHQMGVSGVLSIRPFSVNCNFSDIFPLSRQVFHSNPVLHFLPDRVAFVTRSSPIKWWGERSAGPLETPLAKHPGNFPDISGVMKTTGMTSKSATGKTAGKLPRYIRGGANYCRRDYWRWQNIRETSQIYRGWRVFPPHFVPFLFMERNLAVRYLWFPFLNH